MIGYIFALLPLYVLVYLPISHMLSGSPQQTSKRAVDFNSSFIALDEEVSCPKHTFNTYILSQEPLIIYIEGFLSASESEHLLRISEDKFSPSTVSTGSETSIQKDIRFSEVALLDRDDVVRCIEHRAREFQGWRPNLHIERLRTQRYGVGGHYKHHYDWSGASRDADRVSTFMVYVDADCEGGGTEFPRVEMPETSRGRWCEFLDCGDEIRGDEKPRGEQPGVTFRPIKGNAVFWENLRPDGRGYEETYHAGLPVLSGSKVGLNIWSWGAARRSSQNCDTMPEVIAKHFKAQAARAAATHQRKRSNSESIEPHPDLLTEPDPVELVYNIRTSKFRTSHRSILVSEDQAKAPFVEMSMDLPPLLVDGRMQIVEIPKWKLTVDFLWRTSDGNFTRVNRRVVKLPRWVWIGRNLKGRWGELWIERGS